MGRQPGRKARPPVHGGFAGGTGAFYGDDMHEGRPVNVRFIWRRPPEHAPSWEQAFSADGEAWEVNWVMAFERSGEGLG